MNYQEIGARIREKRLQLGLTQEKLAEKVEISTSFYSHIENGSRKAGISTFYRLGIELGMSLDYMINGTEETKNELGEYESKILFRVKSMDVNKKKLALKIINAIIEY